MVVGTPQHGRTTRRSSEQHPPPNKKHNINAYPQQRARRRGDVRRERRKVEARVQASEAPHVGVVAVVHEHQRAGGFGAQQEGLGLLHIILGAHEERKVDGVCGFVCVVLFVLFVLFCV